MTVSAALEPSSDDSLREYGQRLRIGVAARASLLDHERRRLEDDLRQMRTRAAGRRAD
jgi:hypothetical protein